MSFSEFFLMFVAASALLSLLEGFFGAVSWFMKKGDWEQ